jgi:hypothetical protein
MIFGSPLQPNPIRHAIAAFGVLVLLIYVGWNQSKIADVDAQILLFLAIAIFLPTIFWLRHRRLKKSRN